MMRLLICILLICNVAYATPKYGQDFLALQSEQFNVNNAIRYNKVGTSTGNLDFTFSDSLDNVIKILDDLQPVYHRIHFIDGSCIRNNNCGSYSYVHGMNMSRFETAVLTKNKKMFSKLGSRVKLYCGLKEQYPNTKFLFSPVLEHNLSKRAWRILAKFVLQKCSGVQLVNSPMARGAAEKYHGAWIERHGTKSINRVDIISTDGEGISDINIKKFIRDTKRAKIVYSWDRMYNCRTNSSMFVDPRDRIWCPKKSAFSLLSHIFDEREAAKKFTGTNCKNIKPLVAPWLIKPFAENKSFDPYASIDKRSDMPVIIVKDKVSQIDVLSITGIKLGSFGYYDTYSPLNGHRYYSCWKTGSCLGGYAYEKKSLEYGNSYSWLKVGQKCYGPVLMGIRNGSFR